MLLLLKADGPFWMPAQAQAAKALHLADLQKDEGSICCLRRGKSAMLTPCRRVYVVQAVKAFNHVPFRICDGSDVEAVQSVSIAVYHAVLADAPCSGTGTLRGISVVKWRMKEKHIENSRRSSAGFWRFVLALRAARRAFCILDLLAPASGNKGSWKCSSAIHPEIFQCDALQDVYERFKKFSVPGLGEMRGTSRSTLPARAWTDLFIARMRRS